MKFRASGKAVGEEMWLVEKKEKKKKNSTRGVSLGVLCGHSGLVFAIRFHH